jgi:hypothetical protein
VTHNGETKFHLVHTKGWDNEEIFHWESLDGITWTGVNGGKKTRDGEIQAVPEGTAPNAWAPEFFYDSDSSIFYIFWSTREYDGVDHQRILYRTTSDWRTFSEPQVLLDPGFGVIDLTVMQRDGMFFGVYKLEEKLDEGIETSSHNQKRLLLAQGDSFTLLSGITDFLPSVRGVEGPQFLLVDENQVRLYYDFFANGNGWGASATDSLTTWEPLDGGMVQFPSDVRHGSATPITLAELTTILQYFEDELPPELR